ncbi:MAG: sn-glycerol-1-phosphate dehydrogenase [Pseudomonadota bacterium]
MTSAWRRQLDAVVRPAVARSASIDAIEVGEGVLHGTPSLLDRFFGPADVVLIADGNTYRAAGGAVEAALLAAGRQVQSCVLPAVPQPKPTRALAASIAVLLAETDAIPVVVGSGVLNDVVKFAAFETRRDYLCVATAASMDGYASAGSPLSDEGFKKTVDCRPARVVVADLDVIGAAPRAMSAWGYGDLAGKVPAGADWLVADALGVEPRDDVAWPLVQDHLPEWLSAPGAVATGEHGAIAALFTGLTIAGLAMEIHGTSRPASGADHQIAHLWEMENLHVAGEPAAHGACVAVGCHTVLTLYDWLLDQDLTGLDVDGIVALAPSMMTKEASVREAFHPSVAERALVETRAKHLSPTDHRRRLQDVRSVWPSLREALAKQLTSADEMAAALRAVGAPVYGADLGIGAARHRATVEASRFIRSRYTVLDLLEECGLLDAALDAVFARPAFAGGDA